MRSPSDAPQPDGTARAMERVLLAERDAAQGIAQARSQAQALLDAARDDALAIVNRAAQRIAGWQQSHGTAMAGRLEALRARADAAANTAQRPDGAAIARAAARLAARMTGADEEPPN